MTTANIVVDAKQGTGSLGTRVTLKPKRYVYVCLGCGLLDETERPDRLTCSPACRVRAHRNGRLKLLRAHAKDHDVELSLMMQCEAVIRLRPDLADEIRAGRLEIDAAQPDLHRAFIALVFEEADRELRGAP